MTTQEKDLSRVILRDNLNLTDLSEEDKVEYLNIFDETYKMCTAGRMKFDQNDFILLVMNAIKEYDKNKQ